MHDVTSDIASPIAAYRARLAQGLLKPDPAQALAAEKLESLHHALADYRPGKAEGWLARFGIGRPEEPPLGLTKEKLDVPALGAGHAYRRERLRGRPVYHTPLGPAATAALDDAFARLTDDEPGTEEHVTVQGRRLSVPKAARGVAQTTFDALCRAPLGPADFLALAIHFHTLILDGIPKIAAAERDAAVRFITL